MDGLKKEEIIDKVKALLDLRLDITKDEIFDIYFNNVEDFILDWCNLPEVPPKLYSTMISMIVFDYQERGLENIRSESKGSLIQSFHTEYPPNIMNRLSRHAQVKFL